MSDQREYAYRFEYADKSACEIMPDGRLFLTWPDGKREKRHGVIDNRIPLLIGQAAKPRQDEIASLRAKVDELTLVALNGMRDLGKQLQLTKAAEAQIDALQTAMTAPTKEEIALRAQLAAVEDVAQRHVVALASTEAELDAAQAQLVIAGEHIAGMLDQIASARKALEEIQELGEDGASAARLSNIARTALSAALRARAAI